jgi:hypothetical protein
MNWAEIGELWTKFEMAFTKREQSKIFLKRIAKRRIIRVTDWCLTS